MRRVTVAAAIIQAAIREAGKEEWLRRWRRRGRPTLSDEINFERSSDGELLVRFGDGGITAAIVGLRIDCAGEFIQGVDVRACGEPLTDLIAVLGPKWLGHYRGTVYLPTTEAETLLDMMTSLHAVLHTIHLMAATDCQDIEALRALAYLPDIGERVAKMEGRLIAKQTGFSSGLPGRSKSRRL